MAIAAAVSSPANAAKGFMAAQVEAFESSQFVFERSDTNIPFTPLAYLGAGRYDSAEVERSDRGQALEYDLTTVSQAAAIPWLLGDRDAVVIGEYLNWSEFRLRSDDATGLFNSADRFEVASVGLPVGWIRQVDPRWQAAAFVMPLGHKASLDNAHWSWQYLGGVFTRYVQTDRLWWAFGAYADIAPGDDFYIPYLGASYTVNERWTLSAIMPWPAVLYAPNPDWLFRFGVSPSDTSWLISPDGDSDTVAMNLDAWDLGVSAERRVSGGIFAKLEVGVGGFRGFRLEGDTFEDAEIDASASPYLKLEFNFRPGV